MLKPDSLILIVDDMSAMRKIVMRCMKELGYNNFLEAGDGVEAWDALAGQGDKIKLVLSDWNMPNCPGIELLKKIRGDAKFKSLPFILVTAEADQTQVTDALKSGASGYILKPFSPATFQERIQAICGKIPT